MKSVAVARILDIDPTFLLQKIRYRIVFCSIPAGTVQAYTSPSPVVCRYCIEQQYQYSMVSLCSGKTTTLLFWLLAQGSSSSAFVVTHPPTNTRGSSGTMSYSNLQILSSRRTMTSVAQQDDSAAYNPGISSTDLRNLARQKQTKSSSNNNKDDDDASSRFLQGDQLHALRARVLQLKQQLQDARFLASSSKVADHDDDDDNHPTRVVQQLERAVLQAQQVDAEFVYTVASDKLQLARRNGNPFLAAKYQRQANEAKQALPQFQLHGLWVGKYPGSGFELINVTYTENDVLVAQKVTTTSASALLAASRSSHDDNDDDSSSSISFSVPLSSTLQQPPLDPIQLHDSAAEQWGSKFLPRFAGRGKVETAAAKYLEKASMWMDGQLILVSEKYFSFAWLGLNDQVFFGRPSPELTLKLLRQKNKHDAVREHLRRCWEETEYIEDDLEVEGYNIGVPTTSSSSSVHGGDDYFHQEGCFE